MDYLLDTHLVYWSLYKKEKLPKEIVDIVEDERNNIYMSAMSVWEISTNHIRNPKVTTVSGTNFFNDCVSNNFLIVPLLAKEIVDYEEIQVKKRKPFRKDPYDRMLVAQARHLNYMFCTCDKAMECYDDPHILMFERNRAS